MRRKPDGWLSGYPVVTDTPAAAPDDPAVSYVDGKGFRREGSETTPDYGVTRADMEALRQRHVEAGEERQRYAELNLRRTLDAAPAIVALEAELKARGGQ